MRLLCALAAPQVAVTSETLLARMLDPAVKLGISTPNADPSGDYAWALFARADVVQPGARGEPGAAHRASACGAGRGR
jgi:molybdate transport system substrate-binding protein